MAAAAIPLTVVGGYLGAGKTTLVNHLLRHAGGRRIGVIVNDFGSVGIDADLLAGATRDGDVVSLANGCACCTVSDGLQQALSSLVERPDPPDQVVIEVSGVADPAAAAGWATVAPFEPGGVIVVVAADGVRQLASDRYVGAEVHRQLTGADLLVVAKRDLCRADELAAFDTWLLDLVPDTPRIEVVRGEVPPAVILGVRSGQRPNAPGADHGSNYEQRAWTWDGPVAEARLRALLSALPVGVLRLKGVVRVDDGSTLSVQVVGRRVEIRAMETTSDRSSIVAIGLVGSLDALDGAL